MRLAVGLALAALLIITGCNGNGARPLPRENSCADWDRDAAIARCGGCPANVPPCNDDAGPPTICYQIACFPH